MDFCIARQPIFNHNKRLFAYELLYRGDGEWNLGDVEGSRATSGLLSSTFLTEGMEKITGTKPCFINFTQELLLRNIHSVFPKNRLVIEILEDVEPTTEVVEACRKMVDQGYTLALDDFIYKPKFDPLIRLASIIKVDFKLTPLDSLEKLLYTLSRFDHLKFLAEKVETYEEFDKSLKLGFNYFQGYFFSRPEKIRIKELTSVKINLLRLLAEVSQKKTTITRLKEIVSVDVALTYKLLRFLNSVHFFLLEKVEFVSRAISFLGENRFRRFVMLVIISEIATEKPEELVRLAVVRAKFSELLAKHGGLQKYSNELFLVGLFSLIDAMLDKPIKELLHGLPMTDNITIALVDNRGPYAPVLEAVKNYEQSLKEPCLQNLKQIQVNPRSVGGLYLQAVEYS
ncbi:MAG TPA: HDOD domain-containing protein, partial [Desulfocapsa sulfexigens]|nr:HDOD domain-containing protein [Desulfocapsa sulfexigens]